jgi:four helix bundle protein
MLGFAAFALGGTTPNNSDAPGKITIVLVHGAFAESSSWDGVIPKLVDKGYSVVAIANPLRGLRTDSEYVSTVSFLLTPFRASPMTFPFEKLIAYQKAIDFSDRICQATFTFPSRFYFLVDQLNRAALSIATNITEGNGRFTNRDRKNFFGIARGSTQECVPLLELARRRELIEDADHLQFKNGRPRVRPEAGEASNMFPNQ